MSRRSVVGMAAAAMMAAACVKAEQTKSKTILAEVGTVQALLMVGGVGGNGA